MDTLVNSPLFQELKNEIMESFNKYAIQQIKDGRNTEGLHHSYRIIENAWKDIQNKYSHKKVLKFTDHSK